MVALQFGLKATARCESCGVELFDPRQQFCGGDRCARVFAAPPEGREWALRVGSIGYTGTYRETSADIPEVSVVSVLEARGPE